MSTPSPPVKSEISRGPWDPKHINSLCGLNDIWGSKEPQMSYILYLFLLTWPGWPLGRLLPTRFFFQVALINSWDHAKPHFSSVRKHWSIYSRSTYALFIKSPVPLLEHSHTQLTGATSASIPLADRLLLRTGRSNVMQKQTLNLMSSKHQLA